MDKNELEKELSKEILKKTIVDISNTSEEIFERTLAYFAILNISRK